jgi:hypothetical protein
VTQPEQLPTLAEVPRDQRVWLWERGYPLHLLYSHQENLGREFHESDEPEFIVKCGRQFGKSGWTVWEQLTFPLRNPDVIAHYAAPTAKQLKTIVKPHLLRYLADCPEHIRPDVRWQDGEIRYKNGSILYMAGTESGNAERLRGPRTHQAAIDEASSIADLHYIVNDILSPMTLTTGGRIIMPSTPPKQPAHDFARVYCAGGDPDRRVVRRTVHDAKHLKPETVARLCRKTGGEESATWRREYLALDVYDSESSIVPEFVRNENELVEARERPEYCDKFVVGDIGFVDLSFWLFAYYDFENAIVVIEDEHVFWGKATSEQVPALRKKEIDLWGAQSKPTRYVDASPLVRAEFTRADREYAVSAADNRDLDASVNQMRLASQRLRYRIHPRCRQLIAHMKVGTWNRARTGFDRIEGYGHCDGVAAMTYAVKHTLTNKNPFPNPRDVLSKEEHVFPSRGQKAYDDRKPASLRRAR